LFVYAPCNNKIAGPDKCGKRGKRDTCISAFVVLMYNGGIVMLNLLENIANYATI
jgi:hypothetical protein